MFARLMHAIGARKTTKQQAQLIRDGLRWGEHVGVAIGECTSVYKLEEAKFQRGRGAALCGYVYGFSDVICQYVGLERGSLASINAAVAALNIIVSTAEASELADQFFVSNECRHEFEQGINKGAQGAKGYLKKERWTPGLSDIVQSLMKHRP